MWCGLLRRAERGEHCTYRQDGDCAVSDNVLSPLHDCRLTVAADERFLVIRVIIRVLGSRYDILL
jgi:hypothetical protein